MEKEKLVLCDTNIIIELYRENSDIISVLKEISQDRIAVSVITSGELIYGALNKIELARILKDIEAIQVINIDPFVCEKFSEIMTKYTLSHNLKLPDGLIAATALVHDLPFFTLNVKDFRYIEGLRLFS